MDRSRKLKLGGFVAATLAGLSILVVVFGGAPRLFDTRASYIVIFGDAPGMVPGTPVRKSGVRIGEVTALDLDPATGKVRVSIAVDKKYLPRENEEATIYRGLLSGDTSLDFIPRTNAGVQVSSFGEAIAPDTEIIGTTPINTNTLVKEASGLLPSAQESMVRILNSVQKIEVVVPKISNAFDEVAALARSGREFVPELRRTNEKIQSLIAVDDPKDEGGLRSALNEMRDFLKATKPLVEDIRKLLKDNSSDITGTVKAIRQASEGVSDVLNADNRKNIAETLKNLNGASDDLSKTIKLVAMTLDQAEKTIKNINDRVTSFEHFMGTAEKTLNSADSAFKNIDTAVKPLATNSEPILKNVAMASDQLAKTLAELRVTLLALNRGDGTLQKVLADPALYNNLNSSAVSLTRTLQQAEKIALDLQVFSDKIARRPELIGVGGALRPSSGLKDAPGSSSGPCLPPSPLEVPAFKPMAPIMPTRMGDLPPN